MCRPPTLIVAAISQKHDRTGKQDEKPESVGMSVTGKRPRPVRKSSIRIEDLGACSKQSLEPQRSLERKRNNRTCVQQMELTSEWSALGTKDRSPFALQDSAKAICVSWMIPPHVIPHIPRIAIHTAECRGVHPYTLLKTASELRLCQ